MKKPVLYIPFIALLLGGCQKKDLKLDFDQKVCRKLKINTPSYTWISDPSCGGSDSAVLKIRVKHPQQKDCIEKIFPEPTFYDTAQNKISGVSYQTVLTKGEPDVSIYDDSLTFIFRAQFPSVADGDRLNNIYMKIHTENKLADKSKTTQLRINGKCSVVESSVYDIYDTVQVSSNIVQVTFWDNEDEDGDIISVNLNGLWVLENYELKNAKETYTFYVNSGMNDFVVFAENQGSSGPNTCAITINNGSKIELSQDLKTGSAIKIQF